MYIYKTKQISAWIIRERIGVWRKHYKQMVFFFSTGCSPLTQEARPTSLTWTSVLAPPTCSPTAGRLFWPSQKEPKTSASWRWTWLPCRPCTPTSSGSTPPTSRCLQHLLKSDQRKHAFPCKLVCRLSNQAWSSLQILTHCLLVSLACHLGDLFTEQAHAAIDKYLSAFAAVLAEKYRWWTANISPLKYMTSVWY